MSYREDSMCFLVLINEHLFLNYPLVSTNLFINVRLQHRISHSAYNDKVNQISTRL